MHHHDPATALHLSFSNKTMAATESFRPHRLMPTFDPSAVSPQHATSGGSMSSPTFASTSAHHHAGFMPAATPMHRSSNKSSASSGLMTSSGGASNNGSAISFRPHRLGVQIVDNNNDSLSGNSNTSFASPTFAASGVHQAYSPPPLSATPMHRSSSGKKSAFSGGVHQQGAPHAVMVAPPTSFRPHRLAASFDPSVVSPVHANAYALIIQRKGPYCVVVAVVLAST
jgi:hypothetical protein